MHPSWRRRWPSIARCAPGCRWAGQRKGSLSGPDHASEGCLSCYAKGVVCPPQVEPFVTSLWRGQTSIAYRLHVTRDVAFYRRVLGAEAGSRRRWPGGAAALRTSAMR
jgi:hypothetical protein